MRWERPSGGRGSACENPPRPTPPIRLSLSPAFAVRSTKMKSLNHQGRGLNLGDGTVRGN